MRRMLWIAAASLIALAGCSSEKHATRQLSERERNEAIARSPLPGSAVVGRALAISDRADRRRSSLDSLRTDP